MKALTWVFLVAVAAIYAYTAWLTIAVAFSVWGWLQ